MFNKFLWTGIFLLQTGLSHAFGPQAHRVRLAQAGHSSRTSEKITSRYKSCKGIDLSTSQQPCLDPWAGKIANLPEIREMTSALQTQNFKAKMQKRIIGKIESKIFQIKTLKACTVGDQNWFTSKKIEWKNAKEVCRQKNRELRDLIEKNWSPMRINLALSAPALREEARILSDRATWFDATPSHSISEFNDLPELNKAEKQRAEKIYIESLSRVSLDELETAEFKKILSQSRFRLPSLTHRDRLKLRSTQRKLQENSRQRYFEIMGDLPILGYLKSGNPNRLELKKALTNIESNLQDFLKKINSPSVDMGLLLSFNPLVEELLTTNKNYCSVAERARHNVEKSNRRDNYLMLGAGFLAAATCFITGPIGATVCLSSGLAIGGWGYHEAAISRKESFGRVLTGKEFETMAGLNEREREVFLAKVFLPLAAWGTTAVPTRAASGALKNAVKNIKSKNKPIYQDILIAQKDRLLSSYSRLLKNKTDQEQDVIMQAILGMESKGMNKQTISEKIRTAVTRCSVK